MKCLLAIVAFNPLVIGLYNEIVQQANIGLANYESLKRFRLVPDDWTQESGQLTPSMKLKRRVVEKQYQDLIDKLYADVAEPRPILRD